MGLIRAAINSVRTTLGDQWADFIVLPNMPSNGIMAKGVMKSQDPDGDMNRTPNKGSGAISDGTRVSVPEGYAFMVVENGAIKDIVFEAGEYTWDTGTAPSIFSDEGFGKGIVNSFKEFGSRVKFGGQFANEQFGVYVRLTEIMNNKFGTPTQMAYDDARYGNIYIRSFGRYTFRVSNPIVLIANVTGLVFDSYLTVEEVFDSQLKSEFVMNLVSSMSSIGRENNYPFDMFLSKSKELSVKLAEVLTEEWSKSRGITIVGVAIEGIEPDEESKSYIREVDKAVKVGSNQGYVTMKQLEAMNKLAENEGGGAPNMFMGLGLGNMFGQTMSNMANPNNNNMYTTGYNNGVPQNNMQNFNQQTQTTTQAEAPVNNENLNDAATATGPKFCSECGTKLAGNEKFCPGCGRKLV